MKKVFLRSMGCALLVLCLMGNMTLVDAKVNATKNETGIQGIKQYVEQELLSLGIEHLETMKIEYCRILSPNGEELDAIKTLTLDGDTLTQGVLMGVKTGQDGDVSAVDVDYAVQQKTANSPQTTGGGTYDTVYFTGTYNRYAHSKSYYYQPVSCAFLTSDTLVAQVSLTYITSGMRYTTAFSKLETGSHEISVSNSHPAANTKYSKTNRSTYYYLFSGTPTVIHRLYISIAGKSWEYRMTTASAASASADVQENQPEVLGDNYEQYLGLNQEEVLDKIGVSYTLFMDDESFAVYQIAEKIDGMEYAVLLNFFRDVDGNMKLYSYEKRCNAPEISDQYVALADGKKEVYETLEAEYGAPSRNVGDAYYWESIPHPIEVSLIGGEFLYKQYDKAFGAELTEVVA